MWTRIIWPMRGSEENFLKTETLFKRNSAAGKVRMPVVGKVSLNEIIN
jgi:hypothetical protein